MREQIKLFLEVALDELHEAKNIRYAAAFGEKAVLRKTFWPLKFLRLAFRKF